ncbi:hypothetical protein FHS89_002397 [Rubricella aquisinus]|uniref:Uncharacterized protein n=1 Tax=Rubricella aquisinus TaxID=2028108 RepID=A0A840X3H0_9RHOB|nr:hypothetical protein [Rubricella aquisinus]
MNDETNLVVLSGRFGHAANNGGRAGVAAHGIDRYYDVTRHAALRSLASTGKVWATIGGLCRVVLEIDLVCLSNDFFVVVVTACRANVMRALQLTAVCAFIRVECRQGIVGPAEATLHPGDLTLRDSHATPYSFRGQFAQISISRQPVEGHKPVDSQASNESGKIVIAVQGASPFSPI